MLRQFGSVKHSVAPAKARLAPAHLPQRCYPCNSKAQLRLRCRTALDSDQVTIAELEEQLRKALAIEDYNQAARIRDTIQ